MIPSRTGSEPGKAIAVLGLGVSGAAAARLAYAHGAEVYASDSATGPEQRQAAAGLTEQGILAECGGHDLDRIRAADLVVASPGIAPGARVMREVATAGVPLIGEVEFAYRHLRSRVIAVTGTNGKTTTTALTHHLLARAAVDSAPAGNIGRPLSAIASLEEPPEWVVVELSSFQLANLDRFTPDIGVLLNLAPDHLDRYPDVEHYYADKARLFNHASVHSRWVLNGDDFRVGKMSAHVPGEKIYFSLESGAPPGAYLAGGEVLTMDLGEGPHAWARRDDLRLLGSFNVANALAAACAASLAGADDAAIGAGLASFEALPHRMTTVGDHHGVRWVNDSKATNVAAVACALRAIQGPVVLLLGGRHKGESYADLREILAQRTRAVVAFGEAAPLIAESLGDAARVSVVNGDMAAVVRKAAELAQAGDVVLLSPACSSYDMFQNYRARGRSFEQAFRALTDLAGRAG